MKLPPLVLKKAWFGCISIVAILRLIYAIVGVWVLTAFGASPLQETIYRQIKPYLHDDFFSRYFVNPWFQWDTIAYLKIAILGYENDATIAFMPLYPWLIRLLSHLVMGNYLLAALIISTICTILTLILLYELFLDIYSEEIAWRVVITFIAFPTAFFLLAGYSESLFMTFVLAFWLLARKRQWLWAGLCAGLATLTRLQGVFLSAVLVWLVLSSLIAKPSSDPWQQVGQVIKLIPAFRKRIGPAVDKTAWLAIPIPLLCSLGYQAWLKISGYGTITAALHKYWGLETVAPWTGFLLFLQRLSTRHFNYMDWIDLTLFIFALAAGLIGLRSLDPAFSIYIWLTIAVLLTRGTPPHLLASYSRYLLSLFPLAVLPALLSRGDQRLLILIASYSLQVLLATIFLWGSWVA
jgi:hypothetical protein